jgi:hypothetical protein
LARLANSATSLARVVPGLHVEDLGGTVRARYCAEHAAGECVVRIEHPAKRAPAERQDFDDLPL